MVQRNRPWLFLTKICYGKLDEVPGSKFNVKFRAVTGTVAGTVINTVGGRPLLYLPNCSIIIHSFKVFTFKRIWQVGL
jgi:hypothetical protein